MMEAKKKHKVQFPPKLIESGILDLDKYVPYRCAYGGRGSGKTRSFAIAVAYAAHLRKCNVLVAREISKSIKDSSHAEIKSAIESDEFLSKVWDCGVNYIRHRYYSIEFIFRGLKSNINSIKSLSNIGITWVDEADDVSEYSWNKLIPTVRRYPNSEIWVGWNPEEEDSATDTRFKKNPPPNAIVVEINYNDNPWFPEGLEEERLTCLERTPDLYNWIWEGDYRRNSDAEIFAGKWNSEAFEPKDDWLPYFGLDFGFSQDPTAALEVYYVNETIYVRREAGKTGLELDDTAGFLSSKMPLIASNFVQADCSRPESISYLKRKGLRMIRPCKKWSGSVEDGISFIKGQKKVIIHPDCKNLIKEMTMYRFKVDPNTGDITSKIVDAHNHYCDALRYALDKLITNKTYRINL